MKSNWKPLIQVRISLNKRLNPQDKAMDRTAFFAKPKSKKKEQTDRFCLRGSTYWLHSTQQLVPRDCCKDNLENHQRHGLCRWSESGQSACFGREDGGQIALRPTAIMLIIKLFQEHRHEAKIREMDLNVHALQTFCPFLFQIWQHVSGAYYSFLCPKEKSWLILLQTAIVLFPLALEGIYLV